MPTSILLILLTTVSATQPGGVTRQIATDTFVRHSISTSILKRGASAATEYRASLQVAVGVIPGYDAIVYGVKQAMESYAEICDYVPEHDVARDSFNRFNPRATHVIAVQCDQGFLRFAHVF
jgi:arginine/lysine/ornithine decarboxylase